MCLLIRKKQEDKKNNKSFSLLGVLIAIYIITMGIIGIIGLMANTITRSKITGNGVVAIGLAQEGIEIVKDIRGTNWMNGDAWDEGIIDGTYQVSYLVSGLLDNVAYPLSEKIRFSTGGDGYSVCDSTDPICVETFDQETIFTRIVEILHNPDGNESTDDVMSKCAVSWEEKGRSQIVEIENWLYNWRQ